MILVTSDLHWNDKPRDFYRHTIVEYLLALIAEQQVDQLIIAGDLTEEKDKHSAWLVNKIFDHIDRLAKQCRVTILRGNHDCLQPSMPFFRCLSRIPNVDWINDPFESLDDPKVLYLPHTRDYKRDWSEINVKKYRWVFTHNTFHGAVTETGTKLEGIPRSVFSKKQTVISGDIHVPQKLRPITYVGAPYTIRFGDVFKPRVMLLDEDGNMKSVPVGGVRKVLVDVGLSGDLPKDTVRHGDILKVRVYIGRDDSYERFAERKEEVIKFYRNAYCKVDKVQPVVEGGGSSSSGKVKRVRLNKKRTDEQVLESYSLSRGISDSMYKTGRRLMRKA